MNHCSLHSGREATDETEGWSVRLCESCWCATGESGIEPMWGALYGIAAEVLAEDERKRSNWNDGMRAAQLEHPEAQTFEQHNPAHAHA